MNALATFEKVARDIGHRVFKGQNRDNRLQLKNGTYFEFGDRRVETSICHVIVEHETAGGVTNLAKYWYCIDQGIIKKPIVLFHVYQVAPTKSDYASHLALWDFLWLRMRNALLKGAMTAKCYAYSNQDQLKKALEEFEECLASHGKSEA